MRLLLLEDEIDLGQAIQTSLHQNRYVVDWFQDGLLASAMIAWDNAYAVAVLDWMVPGMSGLELCQQLRSRGQTFPILMLTARDAMADRITGLDAGADDYLVKPFGMQELLARLRALQRRPSQLQAPQLQVQSLVLDYGTFTIAKSGQSPVTLTAKEFQLLEYFMQHPQQILTHDQIKQRLWNWEDDAVSNVVAAQVRLLRRKLAEIGLADWIETIRGIGYRLNPLIEP
jgi:DNA-binding response OmpR family regulator